MARDNEYIQGMESWFKSMELSRDQLKNMIDFHKKEIELHTKLLAVYEEQAAHDESRWVKATDEFAKYLNDNPE